MDRFILLVALAPSIAGFALAFLTRPFPPENQDEDNEDIKQRFRLTFVSTHYRGLCKCFRCWRPMRHREFQINGRY